MTAIFPNGMDGKAPQSTGSKVLVCPHCRTARTLGGGVVSVICGACNKYFRSEDSLPESEALGSMPTDIAQPNPEAMKMRADIERQAEQYAKDTAAKHKSGTHRHHEPGGRKRDW